MRTTASILHLDLDAFFASVEQRDKPSLRGKAVVVGGIGGRGVVSTASYQARAFGIRSAMPTAEARRLAPHAAYLAGRFDAYRQSSRVVMGILRELSPLVEPLSIDEAFVDLAAGGVRVDDPAQLRLVAEQVRAEVVRRTGGLTASVGIGSSKFIAKVASELAKPNGLQIVAPGEELATISPLPARAIPGIGPATMEKLARLGVRTVSDIQRLSAAEIVREVGAAFGNGVRELAFGRDDRPVVAEREAKSISVEDTFETDITDPESLLRILERDAGVVAARLARSGQFARTISIKVRLADFSTWTRSRTLLGATDQPDRIAAVTGELLTGMELRGGVRLLGVGVSNFVLAAQEELFLHGAGPDSVPRQDPSAVAHPIDSTPIPVRRWGEQWLAGNDIYHPHHGQGWVWGAGHGRVTVRFETRLTGVGPVRSFAIDDADLSRPALLPLLGEPE